MNIKKKVAIFPIIIILLISLCTGCGQTEPEQDSKLAIADSSDMDSLKSTIVKISNKQRKNSGTGFFIEDGYVVTASNLVDDGGELSVTYADGTTTEARLISNDINNNTALLKIEEPKAEAIDISDAVDNFSGSKEYHVVVPDASGDDMVVETIKMRNLSEVTNVPDSEDDITDEQESDDDTQSKETTDTSDKESDSDEGTSNITVANETIVEIEPLEAEICEGAPVFDDEGGFVGVVSLVNDSLDFSAVTLGETISSSVEQQVKEQKKQLLSKKSVRTNIITDYIEETYGIDTTYLYSTDHWIQGEAVLENSSCRFYVDQVNSNLVKLYYESGDKADDKSKASVRLGVGENISIATAVTDKGEYTLNLNRVDIDANKSGEILMLFDDLEGELKQLKISNVTDLDKSSDVTIELNRVISTSVSETMSESRTEREDSVSDEVKAAYKLYYDYLLEKGEEYFLLRGAYENMPEITRTISFEDLTGDNIPELVCYIHEIADKDSNKMKIFGVFQDELIELYSDSPVINYDSISSHYTIRGNEGLYRITEFFDGEYTHRSISHLIYNPRSIKIEPKTDDTIFCSYRYGVPGEIAQDGEIFYDNKTLGGNNITDKEYETIKSSMTDNIQSVLLTTSFYDWLYTLYDNEVADDSIICMTYDNALAFLTNQIGENDTEDIVTKAETSNTEDIKKVAKAYLDFLPEIEDDCRWIESLEPSSIYGSTSFYPIIIDDITGDSIPELTYYKIEDVSTQYLMSSWDITHKMNPCMKTYDIGQKQLVDIDCSSALPRFFSDESTGAYGNIGSVKLYSTNLIYQRWQNISGNAWGYTKYEYNSQTRSLEAIESCDLGLNGEADYSSVIDYSSREQFESDKAYLDEMPRQQRQVVRDFAASKGEDFLELFKADLPIVTAKDDKASDYNIEYEDFLRGLDYGGMAAHVSENKDGLDHGMTYDEAVEYLQKLAK